MWARVFNFLWRAGRKPTRQAGNLAKQEISPSKKSRQTRNLAKQLIFLQGFYVLRIEFFQMALISPFPSCGLAERYKWDETR